MESTMNIVSIILFVGAVQGFFLSTVLFTIKRGNRTANRILAVILLIFSLIISVHTVSHSIELFYFPSHENILFLPGLLFGPLLYFYVKALTIPQFQPGKKNTIHFLPFILCSLIFLPLYFVYLNERQEIEQKVAIHHIIALLLIIHIFIYISIAIKLLRIHAENIKESFSSIEKINLKWLRFLIIGFVIIWLAASLFEINIIDYETFDFVWILVCIFMYLIGYKGLKQPEIFSGIRQEDQITGKLSKRKYEKSTLTEEKSREYLKKITVYMQTEKPYLENDITLPGLGRMLSISTHHLSRIINENLNKNFFEFINEYRVEEAKTLITKPDNRQINLASLGLESGFNSISAFNAAFKKHTGITPSQFRASLQIENK